MQDKILLLIYISEIVPSPDIYQQGEVLIQGIVTGAIPIPAFDASKPLK